MPKETIENRIITCDYRGYIYQLDQSGPIVHPVSVAYPKVRSLVCGGARVYEHEPKTGRTVLLTMENIMDPNRFYTEKPTSPQTPIAKSGVKKLVETDITEIQPTAPADGPIVMAVDNGLEHPVEVKSTEEILEAFSNEGTSDEDPKEEESSTNVDPNEELYNNTNMPANELVEKFVFPMNDDGTVNEEQIRWGELSQKKKTALRAKIASINVKF